MNIMGRFTLRSMKANRTWTAVTLIGIIISTAMISAVSTFCESFITFMKNDTIAQTGNWHAMIKGVPVRDVGVFENAGFVGETFLNCDVGYAVLEGSENENKPYLFVGQFEQQSYKDFSIEIIEGRLPQNENEVVLSEHLETNGGIKYGIGDVLTFSLGKRVDPQGTMLGQSDPYTSEVINGLAQETLIVEKTRTYTVTGIIRRPVFSIEPFSSPGYTAIGFLNRDDLGPNDRVTVSLLARKVNRDFFDDVTQLAESIGLASSQVSFNTELLHYLGVFGSTGIHNTVYGFASVFIVLIIVASVTLIYNAFAISVSERIGQMGMLASVGATRQQKLGSVYFEALTLGAVGIPVGILSGILGIGITLSAIRPLTDSLLYVSFSKGLSLHVSLPAIAAAFVLAVLTIAISAFIPARHASKTMPVDAIRQLKEVKLTSKAVKTSYFTRRLFGVEGEIALKNLKRSRKKYRATVLSLAISLILFLTVSYFTQEMRRGFSTVDVGQNFDLCVMYFNAPRAETARVNAEIAMFEDVTGSTAIEKADGFFVVGKDQLTPLALRYFDPGEDIENLFPWASICCLDDTSFNAYAGSLGANPKEYRDPLNPKMILVNFGLASIDGKRTAGEMLSIKLPESLLFGKETAGEEASGTDSERIAISVGMLTDQRPMGVLIESFDHLTAIVSEEVFAGLPEHLRSIDSKGNPTFQQLFLTTGDADSLEARIFDLAPDISNGIHIYNASDMAQKERSMAVVVSIFLYGFIVLMSLICIANIFNTVTTNVRLRRREMAMLRSVGMTPKSFSRMIWFESLFYGLKALLYGLPISIAISLVLYKMSSEAFEFGFSLPWASYGAAIALVFGIVGASMFYSTAKIKKENIIDALRTVTF